MRNPLVHDRVRRISGSFAFIEHHFLRHGFWASLGHHELLLYFFLALVADRQGVSFYSYDKICSLLAITVDEYIRKCSQTPHICASASVRYSPLCGQMRSCKDGAPVSTYRSGAAYSRAFRTPIPFDSGQ